MVPCFRGPQTKLSHGKVDEVGTATQGGCRAGDQDGALFSREHATGRLARNQKSAKAANLPTTLKHFGGGLDNRRARKSSGVVDHDVERP